MGEVEEHAPVIIQPAVAGRQTHAVKQQTVQHFCLQRYVLVAAVGQKDFRDTVEAVLVGFIPVVVIQIQSFRHFQSLLSK